MRFPSSLLLLCCLGLTTLGAPAPAPAPTDPIPISAHADHIVQRADITARAPAPKATDENHPDYSTSKPDKSKRVAAPLPLPSDGAPSQPPGKSKRSAAPLPTEGAPDVSKRGAAPEPEPTTVGQKRQERRQPETTGGGSE